MQMSIVVIRARAMNLRTSSVVRRHEMSEEHRYPVVSMWISTDRELNLGMIDTMVTMARPTLIVHHAMVTMQRTRLEDQDLAHHRGLANAVVVVQVLRVHHRTIPTDLQMKTLLVDALHQRPGTILSGEGNRILHRHYLHADSRSSYQLEKAQILACRTVLQQICHRDLLLLASQAVQRTPTNKTTMLHKWAHIR